MVELGKLLDRQHRITIKADRLWQNAHDTDVFPDLGELIRWLMERPKCPRIREGRYCDIKQKENS